MNRAQRIQRQRRQDAAANQPTDLNRKNRTALSKKLYKNELDHLPAPRRPALYMDDVDGDQSELAPPTPSFMKKMAIRRRMTMTGFAADNENRRSPSLMNDDQMRFFDAIETGDRFLVKQLLAPGEDSKIDVNMCDDLGRTALEIAVDNENIQIVKFLIEQPQIHIGNALLHAVHEGSYKIVELLCNHPQIKPRILGYDWAKYRGDSDTFYNYPNYVSPVVLAAQENNFEILHLFLRRGASIDKPHLVTCGCKFCKQEREIDSLRFSLKRLNIYKALASPAWICLTSNDPVLTAFKLSHKLEVLAEVENEFRDAYQKTSKVSVCSFFSFF